MGIRLTVSKPELHPVAEYLLRIIGNEGVKGTNKIKIRMHIAAGPLAGRPLSRNFNPTLSPLSDLGKLAAACGMSLDPAATGQNVDLDVLNGSFVLGTLAHYQGTNGLVNSLQTFRRADPALVQEAMQKVAAVPVASFPTANGQLGGFPAGASPAVAFPAANNQQGGVLTAAPVPQFNPPPAQVQQAPAAGAALSPRLSF